MNRRYGDSAPLRGSAYRFPLIKGWEVSLSWVKDGGCVPIGLIVLFPAA